ncbi:MAG: hypothetical protein PHS14_20355, partial [Elusimicrobia bacterium]|nr:hypothetical protein [Elusimicrobiota bacterium]
MPTFPSLTLSFADALTQHFQEFGEKRLNSQAWPRSPLVEILSQNGKPYMGGEYMTEVLEDGYTPTGDAFGEGSVLPVSQHNISLPAMYTPKIFYEDVYLDGFRRDKIMTNGDMGPVLQWADEQTQAGGRRARENLALMVCAAATGTAPDGSTRVRSIFDVVKASGSLGNVDPTQFTWWASVV